MFNKLLIGALLLIASMAVKAESITIAAAADLKYAMDEIVSEFKKQNPSESISVSYGSSGKIFTQIQQGAPYDMFFSADMHYPKELFNTGLALEDAKFLAYGRLVLWSSSIDTKKLTLQDLGSDAVKRIAIANPKHAPYGKRAEEALRKVDVWDKIQSKFVFGENIAQTAQFALTGNADIGIIALSLAVNPEMSKRGNYSLIPENLHSPLEQGFVITKRAGANQLAKSFANFVVSKPSMDILQRYGFVIKK